MQQHLCSILPYRYGSYGSVNLALNVYWPYCPAIRQHFIFGYISVKFFHLGLYIRTLIWHVAQVQSTGTMCPMDWVESTRLNYGPYIVFIGLCLSPHRILANLANRIHAYKSQQFVTHQSQIYSIPVHFLVVLLHILSNRHGIKCKCKQTINCGV